MNDSESVWKFRIIMFLKMFNQFTLLSCIKMAYWFMVRKIFFGGRYDNGELGKVFVKKLNCAVWIRKYNVSDFGLLLDFFVKNTHEKGGHYNFPQIDKQSGIKFILDGGGNIGFFSILYAMKFPDSQIITVEPESGNFRVLNKNVRFYDNIIPIKAGVWNKKTGLMIVNPDSHSTGFTMKEVDDDNVKDIYAISIQDIQKEYEIPGFDIIKLDIEGSEFSVFHDDGCDEWLKNTRFVIMEIHDKYMENGRQLIYERMKKNGFSHIVYNGDDFFENMRIK